MTDSERALSVILDSAQLKNVRLATFFSLQRYLEQRETIREILDAVDLKWNGLTELFFSERDEEILQALSKFLSLAGRTAILYARFTGSAANPFTYIMWVQQQLNQRDVGIEHLEMMLQGLAQCLSGLESSAFKSMAPSLLLACRDLLGQSETPISLFDAILDAMQLLCKVPSAVRELFIDLVDLVLGWGSCPETSTATLPKIRAFFQQLSLNWQTHLVHGSELILSIMNDLCRLLDAGLKKMDDALIFMNTSFSLISIFESCAPFLQQQMLTQIFTHARCVMRAMMLFSSAEGEGSSFSVEDFAEQMAEQLSISLAILNRRNVPNSLAVVANAVIEGLEETIHQPEKATRSILLQTKFLMKLMEMQVVMVGMEEFCRVAYGAGSLILNLRVSRSTSLADATMKLYETLLSDVSSVLHPYFAQLFLQDLKPNAKEEIGFILEPPLATGVRIVTSGGRTQTTKQETSDAVVDVAAMKQQLFALTLFSRCVQHGKCPGDLAQSVDRAALHFVSCRRQLHPLVAVHALKLLWKIWKATKANPEAAFEKIAVALKTCDDDESEDLASTAMKWLLEATQDDSRDGTLPIGIEEYLLKLLKTSQEVHMLAAAVQSVQQMIHSHVQLSQVEDFLPQLYRLASSTDSKVSAGALEALKECGSFCLLQKTKLHLSDDPLLNVVLQPQIYSFKSTQIALFVKKVTSGTMSSQSNESSEDWIIELGNEIESSATQVPLEDDTVRMQESSSVFQKAHLLTHEAAKFIVATRFRSIESGPSKLLKLINDRLSDLKHHLETHKPVDLFYIWMLFEFLSALQKQIFCGYDGARFTRSPPQSTWAFYAANKTVFEEGFSRLCFKQLFVSHKCALHHHAAQFGCTFLKHQCKEVGKYLAELQRRVAPRQTVLKIRQKTDDEFSERISSFIQHLIEAVQMTCVSLVEISAAETILGLQHEVVSVLDDLLSQMSDSDASGVMAWMDGCMCEAQRRDEEAIKLYGRHYESIVQIQDALERTNKAEWAHVFQTKLQMIQMFILERRTLCASRVADLETFSKMESLPDAAEGKTVHPLQFEVAEALMMYEKGSFDEAVMKMKTWEADAFEGAPCHHPHTMHDIATLRTCLSFDMNASEDVFQRALSQHQHLLLCSDQSEFLKLMHGIEMMQNPLAESVMEPFHVLTKTKSLEACIAPLVVPEMKLQRFSAIQSELDTRWINNMSRVASSFGDIQTTCALALLTVHVESGRGNVNRAARVLRSIEESLKSAPLWLRFALESEKCRLSLLSDAAEEESHLMLVHYWNVLFQNLKSCSQSQMEKSATEYLSLWLSRFVQDLGPFLHSAAANEALQTIEVPDPAHISNSRYYQQLHEAEYSAPNSNTSLQSVAQMQSLCISLSLELHSQHAASWKQFSQMLLSRRNSIRNSKTVLQNAAMALCKCLQNTDAVSPDVPSLMELFRLLKDHGELLMDDALLNELFGISPHVWKILSGQLFSLFAQVGCNVRHCFVQILRRIAEVSPSSVLYSVLVECRREKEDGALHLPQLDMLLRCFHDQNPHLLQNASVFMDELHRLNALLSEEWLTFVTNAQMESQVRLSVLNEEIKRIGSQTDASKRASLLKESYELIMQPLAQSLRKNLEERKHSFGETPFEKKYWNGFASRCEEVIASLEAPVEDTDLRTIQKRWNGIKTLVKEAAEEAKIPLPSLKDVSPKLAALTDTELPMPGVDSSEVQISHFGQGIEVLSTKTRPKKLTLIGSDGRSYVFLLKGKEDLHIDEHLLQFIQLINALIQSPNLQSVRLYSVTPLGDRIGLIQWVEKTVSFYSMFRQWQNRQQKKLRELNESLQKAKSIPMIVTHHPKEAFQKTLNAALTEADIPRNASRNVIPVNVFVQVYERLQADSPPELLANEIWGISSNAADLWRKTQVFVRSIALGSVLCYALGLGDRHLDNLLLDMSTAEAVNIDFNLCFGSGTKLKVPEIVPFRLTRVIQVAMGFGGLQGVFRECFKEGLDILRKHQESLLIFLEAILKDPVMDWTAERTKRAFHQNLEIGLHLKLLLNRLDIKPLHDYSMALKGLHDDAQTFVEASTQTQLLIENKKSLELRFEEAHRLLDVTQREETQLTAEIYAQERSCNSHLQALQEMRGTVDQILSLNRSWCYRHGWLLLALLDQSDELLLLSEERWNTTCASHAMDFIQPSAQPTLLGLLFGDYSPTDLLPEEIIEQCLAIDEQRSLLDSQRETHFLQMLEGMFKYAMIVRELFSVEYICSSHDFKWMTVFEHILSQTASEADTSSAMQKLEADSSDDLQQLHKSLSEAYSRIKQRKETATAMTAEGLTHVEKEAVNKLTQVQRGLSSGWNQASLKPILRSICQRFLETFPTGCRAVDDLEEAHCVADWVKSIFGLGQVLRLFKSSGRQQELPRSDWDSTTDESDSVSTGLAWFESVERYVSQIAVIVQNIHNGALIDIDSFMHSGLKERSQKLSDQFGQHEQQIKQLCSQSWEIYRRQEDISNFSSNYNQRLSHTKTELENLNQKMSAADAGLSSLEMRDMRQQQQHLTSELHNLRAHWNGRAAKEQTLQNQMEELMKNLEALCERFVQDLCGLTRRQIRIENEDSSIELEISPREWGQMHFPLLHALFKVFELYETSENEIMPLRDTHFADDRNRFPPSLMKLDCWLDNVTLTASLMQCAVQMISEGRQGSAGSLASILERHFVSVLERKIQPIIFSNIQDLMTATQPSSLLANGAPDVMSWGPEVECVWECLCAQGRFVHAAVMHQSTLSWANGDHPDQDTRLRHLAAFEWCHHIHLHSEEDSADHFLKQYLSERQLLGDASVTSREALMAEMRHPLEELLRMREALERCEADAESVSHLLQQHLVTALQFCADEEKSVELIQTMQVLLDGRKTWRQGAAEHISGILNIVQTLLQFEFSRTGQTWSPGEEPGQESFVKYRMWLDEFCRVKTRLETEESTLSRNRERAAASHQIIQAHQEQKDAFAAQLSESKQAMTANLQRMQATARTVAAHCQHVIHNPAVLKTTLRQKLGPWLQKFLNLTEGNRHVTSLHQQAAESQEKYKAVLHHSEQRTDSFVEELQELQSILSSSESICASHQDETRSSSSQAGTLQLELISRASSAAAEVAESLEGLMSHIRGLKDTIHEIVEEPIMESLAPEYSQQVSKESSPWVSTAHLSQADSTVEGFEFRDKDLNALFHTEVPNAQESTTHKSALQEAALTMGTPYNDRPKLTKPMTDHQLEYAKAIMEDFTQRLWGTHPELAMNKLKNEDEDPSLSLKDCTDQLIKEATSTENLCQMYEGWMPWI